MSWKGVFEKNGCQEIWGQGCSSYESFVLLLKLLWILIIRFRLKSYYSEFFYDDVSFIFAAQYKMSYEDFLNEFPLLLSRMNQRIKIVFAILDFSQVKVSFSPFFFVTLNSSLASAPLFQKLSIWKLFELGWKPDKFAWRLVLKMF